VLPVWFTIVNFTSSTGYMSERNVEVVLGGACRSSPALVRAGKPGEESRPPRVLGMLAYVFWHRSRAGVDRVAYEAAQRAFHEKIGVSSACFRLARLPFAGEDGYEDWYLVDGWVGLGALNEAAVDVSRRVRHDRAAEMAAAGWGSVYELVRGSARIPVGVSWRDKARGQATADFLASLDAATVWRRQLALGPAPEFCLSAPASDERVSVRRRPSAAMRT
jgi:hypothetical protein